MRNLLCRSAPLRGQLWHLQPPLPQQSRHRNPALYCGPCLVGGGWWAFSWNMGSANAAEKAGITHHFLRLGRLRVGDGVHERRDTLPLTASSTPAVGRPAPCARSRHQGLAAAIAAIEFARRCHRHPGPAATFSQPPVIAVLSSCFVHAAIATKRSQPP
jgi:hypothetical protein